jgi:hypothetical protein
LIPCHKSIDHSIGIKVLILETSQSTLVIVIEVKTGIATPLLPFVAFRPGSTRTFLHAIESVGQLLEGNVEGGTFIYMRSFFVLEFCYVLTSSLKNGSFVLLGAWDNLRNVLNAFINDFSTAAFN